MEQTIAIRTENIKRYFSSGDGSIVRALDGVSMEIPSGSLTILKGRSGSGKTTLLNLISALDVPTEGKVEFFGKDLESLKDREREDLRRYRMGFVFQSVALIPVMNAYENVEILGRVGLKERIYHMPYQLSGGEQQRVAIARAVAHRPQVIFADEPTGALDTASGLAVMKLFRELVEQEHITVVMTTHDPNLMELGDVVYELKDGRLVK